MHLLRLLAPVRLLRLLMSLLLILSLLLICSILPLVLRWLPLVVLGLGRVVQADSVLGTLVSTVESKF
jgi:hypothetical protein